MLFADLFRPRMLLESAEPGGGTATLGNGEPEAGAGAPSGAPTEAELDAMAAEGGKAYAESQSATPAGEGDSKPAQEGDSKPSAEPIPSLDKLTAEQVMELIEKHPDAVLAKVDSRSAIGRLATVAKERNEARDGLGERDRELERLRAQPRTEPKPEAAAVPEGLDPYLSGKVATFDPEDGKVQLVKDGNWYPQAEAKMLLEAREGRDAYLRDKAETEARTERERAARAEADGEAEVTKQIATTRAKIPALAEMTDVQSKQFDGHVKSRFEEAVVEFASKNAGADGNPDYSLLTDDVVNELIESAAKAEAEYLGYGSNLQLKAKSEAARTEPLPGSGSASLPAEKKWGDLSEQEQDDLIQAKAAEVVPQIDR